MIANASLYSKLVKLLQGISMTSQFHNLFFAEVLLFNLCLFDKLFDFKVATALYRGHFCHCGIVSLYYESLYHMLLLRGHQPWAPWKKHPLYVNLAHFGQLIALLGTLNTNLKLAPLGFYIPIICSNWHIVLMYLICRS